MIIAVDTETDGLDARKFLLGCIAYENKPTETFLDKKKLWKRVLELGKKEDERGHNLYVYAHNHQFDFIGYGDLKSNRVRYSSFDPFISYYTYEDETLPSIFFLDSYALSRMPLKNLGEAIGKKKMVMPEYVTKNRDWINDFQKRAQVVQYCKNDTEIVIKYVRWLKTKLKQMGYNFRRLASASQIGAHFLINELHDKYYGTPALFFDERRKILIETKNKEIVHTAYRGGMIRAFKIGEYKNVMGIDVNKLYTYELTKIPIPDLSTETLIYEPKWEDIKEFMGVAKAIIEKRTDYGMLGIRYKNHLIFPTQQCKMIGTWTIAELEEAERIGHKIIKIEKAVIFKKMRNKLEPLITKFFKETLKGGHDAFFYKLVLNSMIGKLGQHRERFDMVYDELYNKDEWEKKGFELHGMMDDLGIYKRNDGIIYNKFYCPIIPAYVNAYGRIEMHNHIKKIPYYDLLYMDTDSIVFRNEKHIDKFEIGEELGQFKVYIKNANTKIYGKKMYSINNEIRLSGVSKGLYKEGELEKQFNEGKVKSKRMRGLNDPRGEAGFFDDINLDLTKSSYEQILLQEDIRARRLFIDEKERDILFFLEDIKEATKDI